MIDALIRLFAYHGHAWDVQTWVGFLYLIVILCLFVVLFEFYPEEP